MQIRIGDVSREYMQVLGLSSYPFTADELKIAYRSTMKKCHVDTGNGSHEQSVKANAAYEHLQNLAMADLTGDSKAPVGRKILKKEPLSVYDTCPGCKGSGSVLVPGTLRYCKTCVVPTRNPRVWDHIWDFEHHRKGWIKVDCQDCKGSGTFTLKSGREVKCKNCQGTGKKGITCPECKGKKAYTIGDSYRECPKCEGYGEVKLELWNPVLKPGGVGM